MKEELVSFDTAKVAKDKGFDWQVRQHYRDKNGYDEDIVRGGALYNMNNSKEQDLWVCELYSAPTQSLLQRWLREVKNICVLIEIENYGCVEYAWELYDLYQEKSIKGSFYGTGTSYTGTFSSYEKALEAGLQEALKLI